MPGRRALLGKAQLLGRFHTTEGPEHATTTPKPESDSSVGPIPRPTPTHYNDHVILQVWTQ